MCLRFVSDRYNHFSLKKLFYFASFIPAARRTKQNDTRRFLPRSFFLSFLSPFSPSYLLFFFFFPLSFYSLSLSLACSRVSTDVLPTRTNARTCCIRMRETAFEAFFLQNSSPRAWSWEALRSQRGRSNESISCCYILFCVVSRDR